jgi:CheY-like chemotaxis protein
MVVRRLEPGAKKRRADWANEVVIVDDNVALGRQIVAFLAQSGINALHEDNAADGIASIRHWIPDVVVMDIDMPGMDGLAAAKIVAAELPETRLVLMSGYIDQLQRANAEGLDVFAVVDKPLPLHMLARFVRNALGASAR